MQIRRPGDEAQQRVAAEEEEAGTSGGGGGGGRGAGGGGREGAGGGGGGRLEAEHAFLVRERACGWKQSTREMHRTADR